MVYIHNTYTLCSGAFVSDAEYHAENDGMHRCGTAGGEVVDGRQSMLHRTNLAVVRSRSEATSAFVDEARAELPLSSIAQ